MSRAPRWMAGEAESVGGRGGESAVDAHSKLSAMNVPPTGLPSRRKLSGQQGAPSERALGPPVIRFGR